MQREEEELPTWDGQKMNHKAGRICVGSFTLLEIRIRDGH